MKKLSNRRRTITDEFKWNSTRVFMDVGFDTNGRAREVFLTGGKDDTDIGKMLKDTGQIISRALRAESIEKLANNFPYTTTPMPCGNINLNDEAVITITIQKMAALNEQLARGEVSI